VSPRSCADVICLNQAAGLYAVNCHPQNLMDIVEGNAAGYSAGRVPFVSIGAVCLDTLYPVTVVKLYAAPTFRLTAIVAG
jgi:hypothetical protein